MNDQYKAISSLLFIFLIFPLQIYASEIVTIQQKSNMRYLDAHEIESKDFRLVTRPEQKNNTQQWKKTSLGNNMFTLRQESSGRFMDAHEYNQKDFGLVTRKEQKNNTQYWILKRVGENLFTIQQKSNGRYMDAHVTNSRDYEVVTRPFQNNNTQRWIIKPIRTPPSTTNISELKFPVSILTSVIKSQLNGIKIHLNNYGPRRKTTWYRGGDSYVKLPTSLGGSRYTFDLPPANKIPFRYYVNNINLSSFNIGTYGNRFVARFNFEENGIEVKGHCAGKGYKAAICTLKGSDNTAPDIHMKNMVASVYLTPEVRRGSLSFGRVSTDFTVDIRFGKTCSYLKTIKMGGVCNHIEKVIQNGVKNGVKTAMYKSFNNNRLRDDIASAIRSELSKQGVKKIISAKIEGNMVVVRYRR